MKRIRLGGRNKNKFALVDDEDFKWLNKFKWQLNPSGYAVCGIRDESIKNNRRIRMHAMIMKTPKGKDTDHINHNRLDNRKRNLRICTRSQSNMNRIRNKNRVHKSKYKGVVISITRYKKSIYRSIVAKIQLNGKSHHLGVFKTEKAAALAYDEAAKKMFGDFAALNFSS